MKFIKNSLLILFLAISFSGFSQNTQSLNIVVALDGSGDFKTIQEAVNSVRDFYESKVTIFIKPGIYHEKLIIPSYKTNIHLKGESAESTIITNADYSGKDFGGKDLVGNTKFSTYTSYTVLVQGNDFTAENLTIQNTAGRVGQAVALHVEADRVTVKNCNILGNQDTLYLSKDGAKNYFYNCFINGTTDFIFGAATVVFEKCTIESLSNSYVTAASTLKSSEFGFVFFDCKLIAKDNAVNKVYLGRPWRPYAKTVFINSNLGSHIVKEGWNPWKGDKMFPDKEKTAFYAEYNSSGEGVKDLSQRVSWSKQLKKSALKNYKISIIFKGWNPNA